MILKSIKTRDRLFKKYIKTSDDTLKSHYHDEYKKHRNFIVTLCRQSKTNYYSRYFSSNLNNIQKIWLGVRDIISTKTSHASAPIYLSVVNKITSNPVVVSNTFNEYFCSIVDTIRSKLPYAYKNFKHYLKKPNLNSLFISPVMPNEVMKQISSLSDNKANGLIVSPTKSSNYSFVISVILYIKL